MKQCKVGMDQENIISTFASTQFYGDPDAYIREFLQNAIDACNTRAALEWSWGTEFLEMEEARALNSMRNPYSPQISIQYNSETQRLVFEDNGIGINARDIEQYVAKIGVSFYQSEDFSAQQLHYEPVAQFGVGMLSGFMVARALLIESRKDKSVNTAWNVTDRQSLEPVTAKWIEGAETMEYINSNRELAMLSTDYGNDMDFENRQREQTFRGVLSWDHVREKWKVGVKGGYIHTWMAYDYKRDKGNGEMASMTRSRSKINTFYGSADGDYAPSEKWLFTAGVSVHQHLVESADKNIISQEGSKAVVGYDKGRVEFSGSVSAKWRPTDRFAASLVLREDMFGTEWAPVIPAFFIDGVLSKKGNIVAKASVSRNYRFPTLNDLYFLPGGNPNLKSEHGFTYDVGVSFSVGKENVYALSGGVNWFDSHIDDWIIWLPTTKGFFSPRNLKKVHAYGAETNANLDVMLGKDWKLDMNGTFSWTPSINKNEPMSPADQSVGKQLPYVPEFSATVTGRLSWRTWSLLYKWCYYSQRYTMSSNDYTLTGYLPPYFMNNVTLEKQLSFRWANLSLKGSINNLFDEEYLSVLSRPMPGINFEIFIGITPKFGKNKNNK